MSHTEFKQVVRTIASVIPRHIPDPPPVQNRILPLKMSGLKTVVEFAVGVTKGAGAIVVAGTWRISSI